MRREYALKFLTQRKNGFLKKMRERAYLCLVKIEINLIRSYMW